MVEWLASSRQLVFERNEEKRLVRTTTSIILKKMTRLHVSACMRPLYATSLSSLRGCTHLERRSFCVAEELVKSLL